MVSSVLYISLYESGGYTCSGFSASSFFLTPVPAPEKTALAVASIYVQVHAEPTLFLLPPIWPPDFLQMFLEMYSQGKKPSDVQHFSDQWTALSFSLSDCSGHAHTPPVWDTQTHPGLYALLTSLLPLSALPWLGIPYGLLPLSRLYFKQCYFLGSVWVLCPSYFTLSLVILFVSKISHSLNATDFLLHVHFKSRLLSEFRSTFLEGVNHRFTGNSNSM